MAKKINLKTVFQGLQEQMICSLTLSNKALTHPVAKGDATELEWIEMLSTYLPKRYHVSKAFVVDYEGSVSDQIDIVIFDRQYSPFLFHQNGATYIPAESVYAVIEIKPKLTPQNIRYAANKALSVRRLKRTSEKITEARGEIANPKKPSDILAGILTLQGSLTKESEKILKGLPKDKFINLGCSLSKEAFYFKSFDASIQKCGSEQSLVLFFFKLLTLLRPVGTVRAIEIDKYLKNLE